MSTGSPLDHIVQHPIHQTPADFGPLTPEGVITWFSDHISMILLGGILLMLVLPMSLRRKRSGDAIDRMVPAGFSNFIEVICQYLREEVARPILQEHTDHRFRGPMYALGFARIVTHYVCHYAWLEDGILLDGATALAGIRAILIDGRHDPQTPATAEELARLLPLAQHIIVENASHAASNLNIASELVRATNRFAVA